MAAAAYAKDLLHRIPPNKVEAERRISDILSGLQEVAEEQRDIAKKQLEIQADAVKQKWSDKQEECHRLFRLTDGIKDATYEWYKDRVEDRVQGTCLWFLEHNHFRKWLEQESGPLLVSADPGCGKSVLAKYLIDYGLPRSATICYFFFKDQDQNKVRQALCALLHQLFTQKPCLIEHAIEQFAKDGGGLINSTKSLWTVLENAVQDPQAGPVIMVLDALDECAEPEFENLIRNVESQIRSQSGRGKLKYLLTSRPYEQIVCRFQGLLDAFPYIRIPGEEESESISQEVNRVIQYRVEQLAKDKKLSDPVRDHLAGKLLDIPHRTYLWVYLVFDYLKTEQFKKTLAGIDSTIAGLPKNIYQVYEHILNKSKEHPMVQKALSIILAATRPLTLTEMNVALNIDETSKSFQDLDLEEDEDFKLRLRSWCGLFVSIHHGKIYFLHQTAREFLLADSPLPGSLPPGRRWHHSITIHYAHRVLAELCVFYLGFFNINVSLPTGANDKAVRHIDDDDFLDYAAKYWGLHFREAQIGDDVPIVSQASKLCDPDSRSYSAWFRIYWETTVWHDDYYNSTNKCCFSDLTVASYFGHQAVVRLLLNKRADIEAKDDYYGRTPLSWAAENGHEEVVRLLLDKGADIESITGNCRGRVQLSHAGNFGGSPLSWAADRGHATTVRLLLDEGAKVEAKDTDNRTPLSHAAEKGHETVVRLLLDKGADIETVDKKLGYTPLSWAAEKGREAVVQVLLEKGADIDAKDSYGWTPLSYAALNGHDAVVQQLLSDGAQISLSYAVMKGHGAAVKQQIKNGADVEAKCHSGRTLLSYAAEKGYTAVVQQLLDNGADVDAKDTRRGWAPLLYAASSGQEAIVRLLLDKGATLETKNKVGETALLHAARNGRDGVVRLLLDERADVEAKNKRGWTPLSCAASNGYEDVVRMLLNKGAAVNTDDTDGRTPLSRAADDGHEAIVRMLLNEGGPTPARASRGTAAPQSPSRPGSSWRQFLDTTLP